MKVKRKRCKVCHDLFMPQFSTLQITCSVKCAIDYSKLKKAADKSQLNKLRNEKTDQDKLSELIKQTQTLVNKYIRLRDKGKDCISCPSILSGLFDAGHIFDKKQYSMIRFDLDCLAGQCVKCNRFEEGNYDLARLTQRNRIGNNNYLKLENRAKIALRVPYTWTRHELRQIQKEVKLLIKNNVHL